MNLSLKPPVISTLAILLLALISPLFAQENGGANPFPFSQTPYRVGERLTYNVSFSNFPSAAHVELEVVARGVFFEREAVQLRAHVETTGVVNVALYAINNDYTTYINPETGLPFRTEQRARDAIESASAVLDFSQPAGNEAIPPKQRGFPGTYDLLAAFYRARALPLATGAVYNFTVRGDADYNAELKVIGKEVVRTNVGSFPTIATQIKINSSLIKNIKVNFSDDPGHVPVLFTARLNDGELTAELAGSELIKPPEAKPTPTPPIAVAPIPAPAAPPRLEDMPFNLGEQLNYQVFIGTSNTALVLRRFRCAGVLVISIAMDCF